MGSLPGNIPVEIECQFEVNVSSAVYVSRFPVPKLLFGNAVRETLFRVARDVSKGIRNRSFAEGVQRRVISLPR